MKGTPEGMPVLLINTKKVASIPEVGESASAGASEVDNGLIEGETAPTGNSSVTSMQR